MENRTVGNTVGKTAGAKAGAMIALEIDHRAVTCPEGATVLRAAELNSVFVPSLCSHKDLSPFGGCRLCVVEIAGMRGYPLACSTVVQEGMQVLTDTAALREMRKEILELILSEHPASCLICSERKECATSLDTIRKSGVTTGCRYCPNDGRCDLQNLVERLGVEGIHYPILYHGYEAEHDDPFFDRDYNLCILCGRCVRMCQEVRGTAVLAFRHRGSKTRIGPAFGRSHMRAGCEFCGACVSVCPTGALTEKVAKWDGKPDGSEISTCPFCALGCRIELRHRSGRLSCVEGHLDPEVNDGQLCVRGRFCLPETAHHPARARKPAVRRGGYFREVTWPEAIEEAAARLRGIEPEDFLLLLSPDLTNESIYAAQKFARVCLGSNGVDSTARAALPGGAELWAELFSLPVSIRGLSRADAVIAVGLDSRYSFSVAGVEIRSALRRGAALITIDARESNLARIAQHWLRPAPGAEGAVLRSLAEGTAAAELAAGDFTAALAALSGARSVAVVVGPAAFASDPENAGAALLGLGARPDTTILPLYPGANTRGVLELGGLGEWLPGFEKAVTRGPSLEGLLSGRDRPRVLYLAGEVPFFEPPEGAFVIAQDLYLPPFGVDLFLPAASFAEADGTLTNVEGRVQEQVAVERLPDGAITGFARPDWFIFSELARALGAEACTFADAAAVRREIHATVPGFPAAPDRQPRSTGYRRAVPFREPERAPESLPAPEPRRRKGARAAAANPLGSGGFRLLLEPGTFRHRGIDLSFVVEGLTELRLEEGFRIHPEDLEALGLADGAKVRVSCNGSAAPSTLRADADCPRGAIYGCRPHALGGIVHRRALAPFYKLDGTAPEMTIEPVQGLPAETARPADGRR